MFDYRYHVITLIAIFLALGLGILLGSLIIGKEIISSRSEAMIKGLEEEFSHLQEENKKISSIYEEYGKETKTFFIKDKLGGKKIALVATHGLDTTVKKDIVDTLKEAGGTAQSITILKLDLIKQNDLDELNTLLKTKGLKEKELKDKIMLALFYQFNQANQTDLIVSLANKNLLTLEGDYTSPVSDVIVLRCKQEGSEEEGKVEALDFIKILIDEKFPTYGTETTDIKLSYMAECKELGISTVDNIDAVPGQISLVGILEGLKGHYGSKSSAEHFLPTLPLPETVTP